MDNLTHSLVGAVMGQAGLKKTTGLAMPALIIGANLPDVDAACFFWLEGTEHLAFRRGITHGPPALVLLPLILAGLLWGYDRWQTRRGTRPEARLPVRFRWLYAMAFIGCLSHPFFDWLNVYGIRLLEPFSSQWFYGDTLFIIDVWLWALLIAAVWVSRRREKAGGGWMRPAQAGIAAVLAYVGVNGWISQQASMAGQRALELGVSPIASPVPLAFWERELIFYGKQETPAPNALLRRWSLVRGVEQGPWQGIGGHFPLVINEGEVVPRSLDEFKSDPQVAAFLFWSRTPVAECQSGSVVLYDARYYDPRARDRFSVALPDVKCEELPAG
ncbi:MAG: metal-dependent hydrolase [Erythrobacter sp.]|nr:metal-dependent hydrolase [Erythrobacter sp.]MBA4051493.1 metal-dependent hydrolase [Erythrobacter sp.]